MGCKQSVPHPLGLQLSYHIYPEIPSEGRLQRGRKGSRGNAENAV